PPTYVLSRSFGFSLGITKALLFVVEKMLSIYYMYMKQTGTVAQHFHKMHGKVRKRGGCL
ncbi:hypothetical protein PTB13_05215, partial [Bacillus sp. MHSD17]|nr:hypothetical protein [Bacillus sp. MHSD17]